MGLSPAAGEAPALSAAEFEHIRSLAYRHFGLDLRPGKQSLVEARLRKQVLRRGFASFEQYCRHLEAGGGADALAEMGDALTTNFTNFLRETPHFEFLRDVVLPQLASRPSVEIWSAGCSSGEEPYSILFTLAEALGSTAAVRILATDVSTRALKTAEQGIYRADRLAGLPQPWFRRYFLLGGGKWAGHYRVKPACRQRIEWRRFNLVTDPVPPARYPVVFCRNVMIYFDRPTQEAVVQRLASALEPGGYLLIGHSESLSRMEHPLEYVKPAIYRKAGKGSR